MKGIFSFLFLFLSVNAFAVPTTLSLVSLSETAAAIADNAADNANGNQIRNANCDLVLILRNSSGSDSATVTVAANTTAAVIPGFGSMAKSNLSIALTAGQIKHVGPLTCKGYNDGNGYVQLTFSGTAAADVKVTPIRVPKIAGS